MVGRHDTGPSLIGGHLDDIRVYGRLLSNAEVEAVFLGSQLPAVLRTPGDDRTAEDRDLLRQYYLVRNDSLYNELTRLLEQLQNHLDRQLSELPTTLVFRETKEPRAAYLLVRGQYDQRGDEVQRCTPAFLPPMRSDLPRNRLGLAQWLVSPDHPLTSRVAVNRIWQQFFGVGLVKTSEDFGTQGQLPSHPQLLDWLAVEFRESGWNVKSLMKQIVMSATYRQTSRILDPSVLRIDPENRLLARGPRYRLDAEMLRDQALAVSGLLVHQIGGPSVKPPQPDGLWFAVGYSGSNTVRFVPDHDPDKVYRRSLYTFWKRTAPPPQMSTLDAPSREQCTVRRERTNTPLQALLLLNDPQYVEAARHLAQRIVHEAPADLRDRAGWAFEQVTLQPAPAGVLDELAALYDDLRSTFVADRQAAKQLIAIGDSPPDTSVDPIELATWTLVANSLLNLDEVLTRE